MKKYLIILLFMISSYHLLATDSQAQEKSIKKSEDAYYTEGFEALMRLDRDMQTVIRFINTEQGKLHKTRKLLADLQTEKDKLTVLVQADKNIVDALFEHKDKIDKKNLWRMRVESFIWGFFSSLAVVLVVHFFNRYRRLRRNQT